jgi:hypothetical protein
VPLRFWDAREIGLFARPDQHRLLFKRVKAKYDILTSSGRKTAAKDPTAYAQTGTPLGEHNSVLEFTAIGRAVKDAIEQIELSFKERRELAPYEFEEKLDLIAKQHPKNPWVFASYVLTLSEPYWQSHWEASERKLQHAHSRAYSYDPNFVEAAPGLAEFLLPKARKAIDLFDDLLRKSENPAKPEEPSASHRQFGTDSWTYSAPLYWGAKIALNAGNVTLATRWFNKCVRSKQHEHSANLFLAILHLNSGKGPVRTLFGAGHKLP